MNVLVTGGAGYIGSVTSKALLDAGHEVSVFDGLELGHRAAVDPRATFLAGDLRREEDIADAMHRAKPDAVMHFAAYALVGESCADPGKYFRNNVQGGINLVEAMRANGVNRIVFSSTCATYGQPTTLPITESTPQQPTNPYGQSKLMFEQILGWYAKLHGFRPVCLRYFNACGAGGDRGEDHTPETHIIPNILRVALGQAPHVTVFGTDYKTPDGTCVRDYIHVEDLARAHLTALTSDFSGALNLGTGRGFSVNEIVDAARRVTGHAIPAVYGPRRPGDPDELVADPSEAARILGWKARFTDPAEIIATAWRWHQAHPHGYDA
jgi:UDP-glucose 4-epimerase